MFVGQIQVWVVFILSIGGFVLEGYALVMAMRQSTGSYIAAGKWTKPIWTGILGGAAAIGFLTIQPPIGVGVLSPLNLLPFAAIIVAGVFLASTLPALRGAGGSGGGGGW